LSRFGFDAGGGVIPLEMNSPFSRSRRIQRSAGSSGMSSVVDVVVRTGCAQPDRRTHEPVLRSGFGGKGIRPACVPFEPLPDRRQQLSGYGSVPADADDVLAEVVVEDAAYRPIGRAASARDCADCDGTAHDEPPRRTVIAHDSGDGAFHSRKC
jgi:hypothetical protein